MMNLRFFQPKGLFPLRDISVAIDAALNDPSQADKLIENIASLKQATISHLSFLDNSKYLNDFRNTNAGAVIVSSKNVKHAPSGVTLLVSNNPYETYAIVAQMFHPLVSVKFPGVSPSAVVHRSASVGMNCQIDSGVVIGESAEVSQGCFIGANTVIGDGVIIGENCHIGENVTITHSRIGARVMLHSGVRIGQSGFGFAMNRAGHVIVPQIGAVVIEDDVRIGANTTIDRGALSDTFIGAGCMIDNLVQIGHNVQLGKRCVIVAQVGISGSTWVGNDVVIGGQVGVSGHLKINDGVMVAAKSGVTKDLSFGKRYGGIPAVPLGQWKRQVATVVRMVKRSPKGD